MRSRRALALGITVLLVGSACASSPQMTMMRQKSPAPAVGFGKPISEADIAPWNIDIRTSDGVGLPPGRGTVAEGKRVYEAKCQECHGPEAKGGAQFVYGSMVGGIGSFTTPTRVLTPGSMYPYAPILFDYTRRSMPMDKPQTLTNDEVYAVSAYLLHLNGLIPADAVMDAAAMTKLQ